MVYIQILTEADVALITMFAPWRHCVKIILGGSHDNGYSRILSKLVTDNIPPGKVALLQGPPFAAELANMSTTIFPRLQFGDLFMPMKLDPNVMKGSSYVQIASAPGSEKPRKLPSPARLVADADKTAKPRHRTILRFVTDVT
jgi:hypothetical protein